jgi:EEF1A lysine methyltransferase 1
MTIDDEDDDELVLSSTTQAALAEFLAEKQVQESKSSTQLEDDSIDSFPEDWQVPRPSLGKANRKLSQFWYDDETAETLAKELLHDATAETVIAIISAPSVYAKIKVTFSRYRI